MPSSGLVTAISLVKGESVGERGGRGVCVSGSSERAGTPARGVARRAGRHRRKISMSLAFEAKQIGPSESAGGGGGRGGKGRAVSGERKKRQSAFDVAVAGAREADERLEISRGHRDRINSRGIASLKCKGGLGGSVRCV